MVEGCRYIFITGKVLTAVKKCDTHAITRPCNIYDRHVFCNQDSSNLIVVQKYHCVFVELNIEDARYNGFKLMQNDTDWNKNDNKK